MKKSILIEALRMHMATGSGGGKQRPPKTAEKPVKKPTK